MWLRISAYLLIHLTDQLNTTVHGTMKTTPYELVFGQPPRQGIFPGVAGTRIMEEDVEDILQEDEDGEKKDEDKSTGEEGEENSSEDESNNNNAFEEDEKKPREDKEKVVGREGRSELF